MKKNDKINEKFVDFIAKKKFVPENYYPGISDEKLRPILTKEINQIASDFMIVYQSDNSSEKEYLKKIELGLSRFRNVYLNIDTEDRERVCTYVEELMDIINLDSSNGLLNKFMYNIDTLKNLEK